MASPRIVQTGTDHATASRPGKVPDADRKMLAFRAVADHGAPDSITNRKIRRMEQVSMAQAERRRGFMFDSHGTVQGLVEAGMDPEQAARVINTVVQVVNENIATTWDLDALRSDMRELGGRIDTRFANVDAKFANVDTKLSELRADLLKWFIGIQLAAITLIVALVKYLP